MDSNNVGVLNELGANLGIPEDLPNVFNESNNHTKSYAARPSVTNSTYHDVQMNANMQDNAIIHGFAGIHDNHTTVYPQDREMNTDMVTSGGWPLPAFEDINMSAASAPIQGPGSVHRAEMNMHDLHGLLDVDPYQAPVTIVPSIDVSMPTGNAPRAGNRQCEESTSTKSTTKTVVGNTANASSRTFKPTSSSRKPQSTTSKMPMHCPLPGCKVKCNKRYDMVTHVRDLHYGNEFFQCTVCRSVSDTAKLLKNHCEDRHSKKVWSMQLQQNLGFLHQRVFACGISTCDVVIEATAQDFAHDPSGKAARDRAAKHLVDCHIVPVINGEEPKIGWSYPHYMSNLLQQSRFGTRWVDACGGAKKLNKVMNWDPTSLKTQIFQKRLERCEDAPDLCIEVAKIFLAKGKLLSDDEKQLESLNCVTEWPLLAGQAATVQVGIAESSKPVKENAAPVVAASTKQKPTTQSVPRSVPSILVPANSRDSCRVVRKASSAALHEKYKSGPHTNNEIPQGSSPLLTVGSPHAAGPLTVPSSDARLPQRIGPLPGQGYLAIQPERRVTIETFEQAPVANHLHPHDHIAGIDKAGVIRKRSESSLTSKSCGSEPKTPPRKARSSSTLNQRDRPASSRQRWH